MSAEWGDITAGEIIKPIRGQLISGRPGSILSGISTDSREIAPGQLFLALRGERYDGRDFVENAIEKGASCIVMEKGAPLKESANSDCAIITVEDSLRALGDLAFWWRLQHDVMTAAVTGSTGKTTTKEMAADILDISSVTLRNEGNFNNLVGLPLSLLRLKKKHRRAVLEMGMNRPGEIGRLTEIAGPDIGLITNVGRAHLDGLNDIKGVARAKTELIEKISLKSTVIVNGDDNLLMKETSRFKREIITFGTGAGNNIRADNVENHGKGGTSFDLIYRGDSLRVKVKVPGLHNLFNALAASAIALCMNTDFKEISKAINRFTGIKGRFTLDHLPGDIILIDDTYNSNPSSLKAALDSIKDIAGERRIIVCLGEMMELGGESVAAHLEAGSMVAKLNAYYFFAIGDHAQHMLAGALEKGFPGERAIEAESHKDMGKKIRDILKNGDLIFLKGSRKAGLEKVSGSLRERESKEDHDGRIKENNGSR
jgi:UDP-N-acetylmuramoyl-tripeptide--D-alanyl-D-alanine ligase